MGAYTTLLEIEVRHGYYAGEACPGLRFMPTPDCRRWIERLGGVVRPTSHGVIVLADEDRLGDIEDSDTSRDADDDRPMLSWTLHVADDSFANSTEGCGQPGHEAWLFEVADTTPNTAADSTRSTTESTAVQINEHAQDPDHGQADVDSTASTTNATATTPTRLHRHPTVSHDDLHLWSDIGGMDRLGLSALNRNPCGLVRIPLAGLRLGTRFQIRFAPRATVWTYCLVGDWPEPALHIVDLAEQIRFEPIATRRLADGREAIAFRSATPIALQQQPPQQFQLRSRITSSAAAPSPAAPASPAQASQDPHPTPAAHSAPRTRPDKVIVKRLPAAAPRHFSREVIGGEPALVSEIFIHR